MFKKLLYGSATLALFTMSAFFAYTIVYLVSTEIMPAIRNGSLQVETSSMILNVLWEGNEIYILLSAYILIAGGFAYGAIRFLKNAISA